MKESGLTSRAQKARGHSIHFDNPEETWLRKDRYEPAFLDYP